MQNMSRKQGVKTVVNQTPFDSVRKEEAAVNSTGQYKACQRSRRCRSAVSGTVCIMAFCGFLSPGSGVYAMVSLMLGVLVSGNPPSRLTAQGLLAAPVDLRFDSVDFKTVFHWNPPLSDATLNYSVQWKIYGDSQWLQVKGCQGIQSLHCDLSRVTSNSREWYYARVHASSTLLASRSAWALSRRFNPSWDTIISPPTLNLALTSGGIVVRLRPPPALVRKLHKKLCCRIHLRHSSGKEDRIEMKSCSKELVLDHLSAGTRYCLQAQSVVCLKGKSSATTPPICVTTLKRAAARLFVDLQILIPSTEVLEDTRGISTHTSVAPVITSSLRITTDQRRMEKSDSL
ncbi:unnamed protein product [Lota lota]